MGTVWLARNVSTGAEAVLKILPRKATEQERSTELDQRLRNEARVSASLSHRHIVRVFDLVEEPDGTLGLVMEHLRGETLKSYMQRLGPRPPEDALSIILPILGALAHAHDRGIVHRDVTPANIFLAVDPDGHVIPKLVDFGIAKATASKVESLPLPVQTLEGRVLGTPEYMAPERIRGVDGIDTRSDIFAAAVILYEILTGASPFSAATPAGALAAVLERSVDPDPRIDPLLWVEIRRGMAKRPYERHATARELSEALIGARQGQSLQECILREPPIGWNKDEALAGAKEPTGSRQDGAASLRVAEPKAHRRAVSRITGLLIGGFCFVLLVVELFAIAAGRVPPGNAKTVHTAPNVAVASTPPLSVAPPPSPANVSTASATAPLPSRTPLAVPIPAIRDAPRIKPSTSVQPHRAPADPLDPKAVATTPGF